MLNVRPTHRVRRGSFFAAVLFLAACSAGSDGASSAATAAAIDPLAGWTRVTVADEGFSVALPEDWDELSAEDLGESGIISDMASANPAVADTLAEAQTAIESGQIAFFAFDGEPEDASIPFAANVNVINGGATGPNDSAADAAEQMAEGIRAQVPVNGEVETDTVSLPAGESGVVRYEWTVAGANGVSTDVAVTQYAVIADRMAYIVTMTAPAASDEHYGPIFEDIAESFDTE